MTASVSFPSRRWPPPKRPTACPGNEGVELLLVRDLVVIGLIVTLGLLGLVVLRVTRP